MSDPLLIELFDVAFALRARENALIAHSRSRCRCMAHFGPGGPIDVALPQPWPRARYSVTGAGKRPHRSRGASKQCSATASIPVSCSSNTVRSTAARESPSSRAATGAGCREPRRYATDHADRRSRRPSRLDLLRADRRRVGAAEGDVGARATVVHRLADREPLARERRGADRRDQRRSQTSVGGDRWGCGSVRDARRSAPSRLPPANRRLRPVRSPERAERRASRTLPQPSTGHRRQMFANGVDLVDLRAAVHEQAARGLQVVERHPARRSISSADAPPVSTKKIESCSDAASTVCIRRRVPARPRHPGPDVRPPRRRFAAAYDRDRA